MQICMSVDTLCMSCVGWTDDDIRKSWLFPQGVSSVTAHSLEHV